MNLILLGVLGYIAVQLLVGLLVSRRIASEEDYLLAGRSFGYGLATFSFFATWFGAETCIGAAGSLYQKGLSGASADPFGYGACLLFMGLAFAVPLWKRKLTTLADLFRLRYSAGVERLAVLLMVPTSVLWSAAQIRAFGQVLDASSGMGVTTAITIAAAVAIIYTAFGGMRADVITDLIQGLMIILGLAVLAVIVLSRTEEMRQAWQALEPGRLSLWGGEQRSWLSTLEAWSIPILGSVTAQELVARVLSTRSPRVAQRSALLGSGLYVAVGAIPAGLGLIGATLIPGLDHPEQFLPALARQHLAPFFYVLFAGGLVSAILSTVDSTLLAAASLTSHNLVIPLCPRISERGKVRVSRAGVVIFGVVAWGMALAADTIFGLVESASSFGSAGIFVILVFGLFTRFGGVWSALAALLLGVAVWLAGTYWLHWPYVYLASLAAALTGYLAMGCLEKKATDLAVPEQQTATSGSMAISAGSSRGN